MGIERTPIEDLDTSAIDVQPVDMDWSEGWGETWEYIEAPTCGPCGNYPRWISGESLADELLSDEELEKAEENGTTPEWAGETWEAWRCADRECENFGEEIDPSGGYAEGPMMNYYYPFPGSLDQEDAEKVADLPLCIVNFQDGRGDALALTGGGMDLSWEICEAFMRLGQLPPAHYAALPAMAGRGLSERDQYIIAGCRRAAKEYAEMLSYRAGRIERELENVERFAREYEQRKLNP